MARFIRNPLTTWTSSCIRLTSALYQCFCIMTLGGFLFVCYFKIDLVVIPDFMTGAEENWGLIGFTSSMVLFDPEKTSDNLKQDVCETVTHELAHQVSEKENKLQDKYLST